MAPTAVPLLGHNLAFSGSPSGQTQAGLQKIAQSLGASTTGILGKDVTVLLTIKSDFDRKAAKVKKAEDLGIQIVDVSWLLESLESGKCEPIQSYAFSTPAASLTAKASGKRTASGSQKGPFTKKQKTNVTERKDTDDDSKTKLKKVAVGKAQLLKGDSTNVPLDEYCPLSHYEVYIDEDGVIFDAFLNQTNASANNNKFYRLQLIHSGAVYRTWTRWGRVGETGQSKLLGDGSQVQAMRDFKQKYEDKSGLSWEKRGDSPKVGKYTFVERSYEQSVSESEDEKVVSKKHAKKKTVACSLEPAVAKLMELIFDKRLFETTMHQLNYDSQKLPLRKLSKATITRGYQVLKDLSDLLDDNDLAVSQYGQPVSKTVESLSNSYYSVIPHAFGRNRPPIINTQEQIKTELELLESLSDMTDAEKIMKMEKVNNTVHPLDTQYASLGMQEMTPLNPNSPEYKEIGAYLNNTRDHSHGVEYQIESIFRIERNGEFDRFDKHAAATRIGRDRRLLWHGSRCTNYGGILSQGLRIAPPEAPVSGYMFGKGIYLADMSSKSANYCASNLSNGTALLLLCEADLGDPMLELLDVSYTAGEDAAKQGMLSTWGRGLTGPKAWKDAKYVHPSMWGTCMPDSSVAPGKKNVPGSSLLFNEYICYNVEQVRLRYLLRVKM